MELYWRPYYTLVSVAMGTDLEHNPQEVLRDRADVYKISEAQRARMAVPKIASSYPLGSWSVYICLSHCVWTLT